MQPPDNLCFALPLSLIRGTILKIEGRGESMRDLKQYGWRHPGKRADDYGKHPESDHDRRTYASAGNFGKGPKNYKRSQEKLREEVCEALLWDPGVDATDIEVSVKENRVTLKGRVDSRHAKTRAEAVVENIPGVEDIFNLLIVKPLLDLESDKIITRGDDGLYSEETIQR